MVDMEIKERAEKEKKLGNIFLQKQKSEEEECEASRQKAAAAAAATAATVASGIELVAERQSTRKNPE